MTAMARQKCWWCRNWSCLRSGGTWLVHLMSVALALPLNRPAGFGIAGRQCNSLQYNGLLLFWPPPLVLVHYSTLHGWKKHWQCPFPHSTQIFIFIVNQNEKLILDHVAPYLQSTVQHSAYFGGESKTALNVPQNEVALLRMLLLVLDPALPTSKTLNSRGFAISEKIHHWALLKYNWWKFVWLSSFSLPEQLYLHI